MTDITTVPLPTIPATIETTIVEDRLDTVLDFVREHPDIHQQAAWRCGTGMCFAGWAASFAGAEYVTDPNAESQADVLVPPTPDLRALLGSEVTISTYATAVLGLSSWQADVLFASDNTVADLTRIVADLKAGLVPVRPAEDPDMNTTWTYTIPTGPDDLTNQSWDHTFEDRIAFGHLTPKTFPVRNDAADLIHVWAIRVIDYNFTPVEYEHRRVIWEGITSDYSEHVFPLTVQKWRP